ncbi:MAG TPA: AAA family ATPase [Nocardioidaceae bacterium]|nr:AAA family ATPase [Nocardioidaceae bacterium]
MPRLIHLNGPSRVGKSTLARRYVDEHPGMLALDLDVLTGLIGGWRDNFSAALDMARAHGRALTTRHLREGYDVVLPQLVTVHDRDPDPGLEETARGADATYIEVALLVDHEEHVRRLRGKQPTNEIEARIQTWLEDPDSDLIDRIRQHLNEYLAERPHAIRLNTTGLGEDASYERLLDALAAT